MRDHELWDRREREVIAVCTVRGVSVGSLLNHNFQSPLTPWISILRHLYCRVVFFFSFWGWGLTGQRWSRSFYEKSFPCISWYYIDPGFSLVQRSCLALCSWFTQECLEQGIKHAKFCDETVGFRGFGCCRRCFLLRLRKYQVLCLLLLVSNSLVSVWDEVPQGRRGLGLILGFFFFFPQYNPNLLWLFWVSSSAVQAGCPGFWNALNQKVAC